MKQYPVGFTPIATQDFIEQSQCDNQTDMEFKVGYGTLNPQEITFLKDPTNFIGVTIRKAYDEVLMRAKGTVYISSDFGGHAYRNSGNLIEKAWSQPHLLEYVLLHEVGHVMGISHLGIGLMSETFLSNLLNHSVWTFYASRPFISLTRPLGLAEVCLPDVENFFEPSYFGLTIERCLRLERRSSSAGEWAVLSSDQANSKQVKEIGKLKITSGGNQGLAMKPVVLVYLTKDQKVFKSSEMGFSDYLVGAVTSSALAQGILTFTGSHKPYHVQLAIDPEYLVVSGIVGNQIRPVFSQHLPTLKGVAYP